MSTSLLYHGFGIRGYQYTRTEYVGGRVLMWIEQPADDLRCPQCGSRDVTRRGTDVRSFHLVPIGSKHATLVFPVPRVLCSHCAGVRQVRIPFAGERRSYTLAFERYVVDLSRHMTLFDVARHLDVGWWIVKDIVKRHLTRRFARPKLKALREIAIDEISIGKGHHYLTVVLNLTTGAVIFVAEGKGAEALTPFWKKLRAAHAHVTAVAMDMGPAYIAAVQKNLPGAVIVFDHFHVIKLFNEKLADLRRALQSEATEDLHKKVLKGTRWLLLKNPENLDDRRDERTRLDEALRLNKPLATAYYLREDLRQLWDQPDKATAERVLQDWIARAQASGVKMLQNFAKTLAGHRSGILAYYDYRISTGPLEGTNTKIKLLQRKAYGFRDMQFFRLKIMALHESRIDLVG